MEGQLFFLLSNANHCGSGLEEESANCSLLPGTQRSVFGTERNAMTLQQSNNVLVSSCQTMFRCVPMCLLRFNQYNFDWWSRYKRNYAPGWSRPTKWVGKHRRRSLLQAWPPADNSTDSDVVFVDSSLLHNTTFALPPCLQSGQSYKNTCKQCNFTNVTATITANAIRSGYLAQGNVQNPIGFVAPAITVTPDGSIVIVTGYSGPRAHPNSDQLAYPGEQLHALFATLTEQ
jgi:hypothetical protein